MALNTGGRPRPVRSGSDPFFSLLSIIYSIEKKEKGKREVKGGKERENLINGARPQRDAAHQRAYALPRALPRTRTREGAAFRPGRLDASRRVVVSYPYSSPVRPLLTLSPESSSMHVVPSQSSGGSSPQVFQTLAWLRTMGFRPVPLHVRSKAATRRDYVSPSYIPPSDELWASGDFGVGVVTGPSHGGPIDIDLDCPEALALAPMFLPPTPAIFGRDSKPASHWLYSVTAGEFAHQAFIDPVERSTLVERRGDGGHQTVMPGSIHADTGEVIRWESGENFPRPAQVDPDLLARAVRKLALASLVVRHLWHSGQRNEVCKLLSGVLFYAKWEQSEVEQFVEAIAKASDDDDATRTKTVRLTFARGQANRKVAGLGALRRFLNNPALADRIAEWSGSETAGLISEFNERFAVVDVGGKYRVALTDVEPSTPPQFYYPNDFLGLYGTETIPVGDPPKPKPKALVWLNSPQRLRYNAIEFLPGVEEPENNVLNLWTGWAVKPEKGDCTGWLELLRDVVCGGNEQLSTWMLHWFANILREPLHKPMTSPVLVGTQGAGKSLLVGYFGRILGSGYVVASNPEHVVGKFNSHISTALLLHSEEALYAGDRKHRSILKSLITDEYQIFEPKGIDARRIKSSLRLILTSNEEEAAPIEAGDRRFTVVHLKDRKLSPALRDTVIEEMQGNGPAALAHYLLNMEYDPKIPRGNIKTDAHNSIKEAMLTPIESWWLETLREGKLLPPYLEWAKKGDDDWPEVVGSVALYEHAMHSTQGRWKPNAVSFYAQLRKMVAKPLKKSRRDFENAALLSGENLPHWVTMLPGTQIAILNLPDLAECRKAMEKHLGSPVEWPQEQPEDTMPAYKRVEKKARKI